MNRHRVPVLLSLAAMLVCAAGSAHAAAEPVMKGLGERAIAGVDLGAMSPLAPLDVFADTGGSLSPWAGYMFNSFIGALGELHFVGAPTKNRVGKLDANATWILGASVGPRIAINFGGLEIYGTWQAGGWTGVTSPSPVDHTSFGWATGGGVNLLVSKNIQLGGFARYNFLYQDAHGTDNVRYVESGAAFTYNFLPEVVPPPPPPPPVAQAAPPPPPAKKKIVLRGVNFDFDKAVIRPDAMPVLDEAIRILKEEGDISIVAAGFTDSIGSAEYNMKLSLRRAEAVRDYLVKGGIAPSRIKVEGFGKNDPVASNATADGRAQNRRVELRVAGQ